MKSPIKVLHTEWSDGWGGQEIRIINEMLLVQNSGVQVYLACKKDSLIRLKAQKLNLQTFELPFRGNADFITFLQLKKIISKYNINILNSHSSKDTWVGGLAAKSAGIKFIRTRHLSIPIKKSRLNFINELADHIFTTGESIRADMINHNRIRSDKIKSIPSGVDSLKFNPIKYSRKKCRAYFKIQNEDVSIGMISVLRRFKRHDKFLKMARKVIDQNPDKSFKFFIAGDGPQKSSINLLIDKLGLEKNIQLLGHIEQVPEMLSALDIFVMTSDSGEGVPQSLMQALMMEKPVISTNAGSTIDVYYNDNFVIVDSDNQNQLVNACNSLVRDEKLRQKYQKNSRGFVLQNFSNENMVKKILEIYGDLIQK